MPTQTEALVKQLRAIKARIDYLEAWEGSTLRTVPELILPAWGVGTNTPLPRGLGPTARLADATDGSVYFSIRTPETFQEVVSAQLVWTSPAAAGNLYWSMNKQNPLEGEAYNTHQEYPGNGVTPTVGANIVQVSSPPLVPTWADVGPNEYLGIMVNRRADLASDTLGDVVYVIGLLYTYTMT